MAKSKTAEYHAWENMWARCAWPPHPSYKRYGGRGIKVDPRWDTFDAFFADMGLKPGPEYSLERRDNMAGYSKENCCWATRTEQAKNSRNAKPITFAGKTMSVRQWAKYFGIPYSTFSYWIHKPDLEERMTKMMKGRGNDTTEW